MYLLTKDYGIVKVPELRRVKSLFCRHNEMREGAHCSKNGMTRISGQDIFVVCMDCGKILHQRHEQYW